MAASVGGGPEGGGGGGIRVEVDGRLLTLCGVSLCTRHHYDALEGVKKESETGNKALCWKKRCVDVPRSTTPATSA